MSTPRATTPIDAGASGVPVVASPQAVLSHVAGSEPVIREMDSAEMALLGEDVGDALTLTPTGASDVLMAEAHGLREAILPDRAGERTDEAPEAASPREAESPARSVTSPDAPTSAAPVAADPRSEPGEAVAGDPFAVAALAPVVESDWWSADHEATPVAPVEATTDSPQMIGGTAHEARVAAHLEALANRVRAGEIPGQSVPCDAGDAAFLAGLLTSLLLSRSSA